jgi:hypothetical protein
MDDVQQCVIEIHAAKGLQNTQFVGSMSPYVVLTPLPSETSMARSSRVDQGGSDPSWNKGVGAQLLLTLRKDDKVVLCRIYNTGILKDELIGTVEIGVEDIVGSRDWHEVDTGGFLECTKASWVLYQANPLSRVGKSEGTGGNTEAGSIAYSGRAAAIEMVSATALTDSSWFGLFMMAPFVVLTAWPSCSCTVRTHYAAKGGKSPRWTRKLSNQLFLSLAPGDSAIKVEVFNANNVLPDDLLGSVEVTLPPTVEQGLELQQQQQKLSWHELKQGGQIQLSLCHINRTLNPLYLMQASKPQGRMKSRKLVVVPYMVLGVKKKDVSAGSGNGPYLMAAMIPVRHEGAVACQRTHCPLAVDDPMAEQTVLIKATEVARAHEEMRRPTDENGGVNGGATSRGGRSTKAQDDAKKKLEAKRRSFTEPSKSKGLAFSWSKKAAAQTEAGASDGAEAVVRPPPLPVTSLATMKMPISEHHTAVLLELKSEGLLMDTPIVSFIIELDALEQRGSVHNFQGAKEAAACPLALAISEYKTKSGALLLLAAYFEEGEMEYEEEVERIAKAEAAEAAAEEARREGEARAKGEVDAARKEVTCLKITGALKNAAAHTRAEQEQQKLIGEAKATAAQEIQRAKVAAEQVELAAGEVERKVEVEKKAAEEEMEKMRSEAEEMKNEAERNKKQARIHLQSAAMAASEAEREASSKAAQHAQELDQQREMIIAKAEIEAREMVSRALRRKEMADKAMAVPKKWTAEQVDEDFKGWIEAQIPTEGAKGGGCFMQIEKLGYDELDSLQDLVNTDDEGVLVTKFGITAEQAGGLAKGLKALKTQGYMEIMPGGSEQKTATSTAGGGGGGSQAVPLKDIEEYQKYFKMLKMGLPKGAAQQQMVKDGKDPAILDLDPEKPLATAAAKPKETGPLLKDVEEYQKYFKMLKMGLPKGAAQQQMVKDGKDPAILDLDPEKPLPAEFCESQEPTSPGGGLGFLRELKKSGGGGGGGSPMGGLLGGLGGVKLKSVKREDPRERSASASEEGDDMNDVVSMIKNGGIKLKKVDRSNPPARERAASGDANPTDIVSMIKNGGIKLKKVDRSARPVKDHRRVQSEPMDMMSQLRNKLKSRSPEIEAGRNLLAGNLTRPIDESVPEGDEPVPEPVVQPVVYEMPSPSHSFALLTDPAGPPPGVNPLQKDEWLLDEDFEKIFGVERVEFMKIPKWKRDQRKRDAGLW